SFHLDIDLPLFELSKASDLPIEAMAIISIPQVIAVVLFARHKVHAAVSAFLTSIFVVIIAAEPWHAIEVRSRILKLPIDDVTFTATAVVLLVAIVSSPIILLSVARQSRHPSSHLPCDWPPPTNRPQRTLQTRP